MFTYYEEQSFTSLDVYFAHSGKSLDKAGNYLSVRKAMRSGE